MKNIGIIGGGVVGLFSAYYLSRAGHKVKVFEAGNLLDTCSIGNAGMVVPSHIVPLAAPGMISKGIRWMFNSRSPFYVKPRFSSELFKWGLKFYNHANDAHVERSIPVLKEISLLSKGLYQQLAAENLFDFGYQEKGLMMLYQSKETEREEIEAAHQANRCGVEAHVLSIDEVQKMETQVRVNARGGVFFPGDAHLMPHVLIANLIQYLKNRGVEILDHTEVKGFEVNGKKIQNLILKDEQISFDEVIITTGAWSGELCSKLGIQLPMQSGKGYSFTLNEVSHNVQIPSILIEGRVAVTPMGTSLRFGGTMEINGTDRSVNMNRVKGIVETISKFYPEMNVSLPKTSEVWNGLRPCSPDGLPYIGRPDKLDNVIVATGHSMMGLSLGPASGKLVKELVDRESMSMNLDMFHPSRFER